MATNSEGKKRGGWERYCRINTCDNPREHGEPYKEESCGLGERTAGRRVWEEENATNVMMALVCGEGGMGGKGSELVVKLGGK